MARTQLGVIQPMTKLAAIAAAAAAALTLAAPSRPAAASSSCTRACSPLFDAMGWTLAAGLVGGYAYGTGYFIYRDATEPTQSVEYGGGELTANGLLGTLFTAGAVDAARHGHAGATIGYGAFAALHLTLAAHGGWRIYDRRGDIHPSPVDVERFAGLAYGTNTVLWALGALEAPGQHGRGYGAAEAAVNAPLAAGLGYLAYEAHGRDRAGQTALYGGMAAISGALAIHGLYTALAPRPVDRFEVLGASVAASLAPTMVSDGRATAAGLGASGTW